MPRDGAAARERLRDAALELYRDHGYDATTTAQIAERAGVTERTYFRHFADKREVLFDGETELLDLLIGAIEAEPEGAAPLDLVLAAYRAAVPLLVEKRPIAERRASVIAVTPALQERAHAKSAALVDAVVGAVVARGVPEATARLAARIGAAVFERASREWGGDPAKDLGALIDRAADEAASLRA
jgi:AcrR family transcriptional regulator